MWSVAESSKCMHNSLFSLDSTMPWFSWASCLNTVEDNPEKTRRNNLTTMPFNYINNASVYLNEVCLHITYLFIKELVIVSDVFSAIVFLLTLLSCEKFAFIAGRGMMSLFTKIDSSRQTAVFPGINFIHSFLLSLLIYFFKIDPLEPSFIDSVFRFRFHFRFHYSGFGVLVPHALGYTLSLIKTNKFKCEAYFYKFVPNICESAQNIRPIGDQYPL